MKRLLVMMLALMMALAAIAEGAQDLSAPEFVDIDGIEDPVERAKAAINYFHSILYSSELYDVTIYPNTRTDDPNDTTATVYMNYTDVHDVMPSIDKDIAVRVSNTVAMAIEGDCPKVSALAVLWHFLEYDMYGKITYTIDKDGVHYDKAVFPSIMDD